MLLPRKPIGPLPRVRRHVALAVAMVFMAGLLAAAFARPAAAQTGDSLFLANSQSFGMYAESGVTQGSPIGVKPAPWGTWAVASISGCPGCYEFASITTKGIVSDLCLANTGEGTISTLQPCGADGTVFIDEPSGDGCFLLDRYDADTYGQDYTLAVYSPASGRYVDTVAVSGVGGSWFGRWNDTAGFMTNCP